MTTTHTTRPDRNTSGSGSDFAGLRRLVDDAGLLRRRPRYYAVRIAAVIAAFALGWAVFIAAGDTWWQLLTACFLAVVFAQVALVAHDLAHRQVFRTRRPSEIAGRIAGNLMIGMGYGWWMDKHTRHHANPNHEGLDPDIAPDVLVWSQDQARGARGIARFVGRYEAWLFFPLLMLEGVNLHASGLRSLRDPALKARRTEATLLIAHFVLYLGTVFAVLSPVKALAFLLVHQAVFGVYLGCSFAPNHKGMPIWTDGERPDFLRRQVLTSRNVRGGPFVDLALGGLNYQIEHHLFPSMPMPHLRKAQPIVRDYCDRLGIAYCETGLVESYAQALRHMHAVGEPLRRR